MPPPIHAEKGAPPRHALLKMAMTILVAAFLLLELINPGPRSQLQPIIFFGFGLPAVFQLVIGFASIFGPAFFRLTKKEMFATSMLASILAIPSLGGGLFLYIFISMLLACYGGHCGGSPITFEFIYYMPLVMIAWGSALTTRVISDYFSKREWWPPSLKPEFDWFSSDGSAIAQPSAPRDASPQSGSRP